MANKEEKAAAEDYERELEKSNDLWRKDKEDLVEAAFLAGIAWRDKHPKIAAVEPIRPGKWESGRAIDTYWKKEARKDGK